MKTGNSSVFTQSTTVSQLKLNSFQFKAQFLYTFVLQDSCLVQKHDAPFGSLEKSADNPIFLGAAFAKDTRESGSRTINKEAEKRETEK